MFWDKHSLLGEEGEVAGQEVVTNSSRGAGQDALQGTAKRKEKEERYALLGVMKGASVPRSSPRITAKMYTLTYR